MAPGGRGGGGGWVRVGRGNPHCNSSAEDNGVYLTGPPGDWW